MHSEFEESEDNLLTLVLFNPIRSWVNPKIYWHFKLTGVASLAKNYFHLEVFKKICWLSVST